MKRQATMIGEFWDFLEKQTSMTSATNGEQANST